MTTLFRRIFLWFWLAMLAITLTTGAVVLGLAWNRFAELAAFDRQQTVDAAQAALNQGGERGLREWLSGRVAQSGSLSLFVLDPAGRDVLGRAVPPAIRFAPPPWADGHGDADQPSRSDAHRGDGGGAEHHHGFMRRHSHVLLSATLTLPGHPAWWLIAAWAGSTPFDVLGSPGLWIVAILLAILISSGLCWVLARGISQPIVDLQGHARQLAKGRFDALISGPLANRKDEIGQLAGEFNLMATQIQGQLASKEMLLRDISHEMRSPLTRLRVAVSLARAKGENIDTQIDRIERDIERLDRLIDDTLRFSMVTTPGLALTMEPVDLAELVVEAMRDAEIEAAARDIRLTPPALAPAPVALDADLFYRAIDNVLRNAIRHSPDGGQVIVTIAQDSRMVRLAICDEGPGVPDDALERIFEAFYRVSAARERQTGGAGLGLALTARIANLHGGRVVARNASPRGLVIEITLPAAAGATILGE